MCVDDVGCYVCSASYVELYVCSVCVDDVGLYVCRIPADVRWCV